jgi:hypothetical protein
VLRGCLLDGRRRKLVHNVADYSDTMHDR